MTTGLNIAGVSLFIPAHFSANPFPGETAFLGKSEDAAIQTVRARFSAVARETNLISFRIDTFPGICHSLRLWLMGNRKCVALYFMY
jgi:hypothetical protein